MVGVRIWYVGMSPVAAAVSKKETLYNTKENGIVYYQNKQTNKITNVLAWQLPSRLLQFLFGCLDVLIIQPSENHNGNNTFIKGKVGLNSIKKQQAIAEILSFYSSSFFALFQRNNLILKE